MRSAILVCCFSLATAPSLAQSCPEADTVLRNGKIVTLDAQHSTVNAMAVRNGRIIAVGTDDNVSLCVGKQTQVINLASKTVIPGLIDVHTHALEWAKSQLRNEIDLTYPNVKSVKEVVALVQQRASVAKPGEWIVGKGWDDAKFVEKRYLNKHDLDAVAPDNPVYLVHVSGHLSVTNSAGLKQAGLTAQSKSPEGGEIQRDSSGELTGILKDTAVSPVAKLLPADPPDLPARAAKFVSERALSVGLTTIHDIYLSPLDTRGYEDAYEHGWLKLRVVMSPPIGSLADAEKLASMGVHTGFGNDHVKFGAAKMFADGGMGARTIAIYPPGIVDEPENIGLLRWKPEDMQKAHLLVAAAGWQLETHAIGDRAIDEVLDSYAKVIQTLQLKDSRLRIVHAGVSTPAVQKRMKELGVVVDGNPPFVYWIGSWFKKYGPDRVRWSYPAKSYIDNGIVEAAGSDVNVTPLSPWWGIWSAVERKELQTGEVLAPEERITVLQALRLYTLNGAYAGFEEANKGSLEKGKFADFVVLDRDVLTIPSSELKDVQVLRTYVGGELVYSQPR